MSKKEELFRAALKSRKNAHAPYSEFYVGCAVLDENQQIHSGCNVENSAYPTGVCAEQATAAKAVSEGAKKILEVVVVTDRPKNPSSPCGNCRQFLSEFLDADASIHLADLDGVVFSYTMQDLLPHSFARNELPHFQT